MVPRSCQSSGATEAGGNSPPLAEEAKVAVALLAHLVAREAPVMRRGTMDATVPGNEKRKKVLPKQSPQQWSAMGNRPGQ